MQGLKRSANIIREPGVLEQRLGQIPPCRGQVYHDKIQNGGRRCGVGEGLLKFQGVQGLESVERRIADGLVAVFRKQGEDFDLFFERNRQFARGSFSADDVGSLALAQ